MGCGLGPRWFLGLGFDTMNDGEMLGEMLAGMCQRGVQGARSIFLIIDILQIYIYININDSLNYRIMRFFSHTSQL